MYAVSSVQLKCLVNCSDRKQKTMGTSLEQQKAEGRWPQVEMLVPVEQLPAHCSPHECLPQ